MNHNDTTSTTQQFYYVCLVVVFVVSLWLIYCFTFRSPMPDRIRYSRWPQALTWVLFVALFFCGWWLEERFLQPPGWRRAVGQLTTGEYDVQRVVDGDTIVLEQDNLRVRLQGIDSPETFTKDTAKQDAAIETWGLEATEFTKQFLKDSNWHVQLVIDGEPIDRYGRHLAFVWRDGRLLNEELVQQGLARAKTTFQYSRAMKKRLQEAQFEAQAAQRGIWSAARSLNLLKEVGNE